MALQFRLNTASVDDLMLHLDFREVPTGDTFALRTTHLPAEWFPQSAVQLTWPHAGTDWAPTLKDAVRCYVRMAFEIALRERLLIVTPEPEAVESLLREQLPQQVLDNISFHRVETDDTWARDHGFLTLLSEQSVRLLDFRFNGWGEKFPAEKDNRINRRLWEEGIFRGEYEEHLDFVLEGGSIESDGRGTLLTTSQCLMAPHRNQPLSQADIELRLLGYFHAQRVLWLHHGHLEGDDTDGHIDTLARFCPYDTIAFVQCTDPADRHYTDLQQMEAELESFRTLEDKPYRLVPLPMAEPAFDEDGNRLPATYANFLVLNGAVLMPAYGHPETDEAARLQLQKAFPRHEIVPIDARPLIVQHGSIHCCAMQFPRGAVAPRPESTNPDKPLTTP